MYSSLLFYEFTTVGAELKWHSSDLLTAVMEKNGLMRVSTACLDYAQSMGVGIIKYHLNIYFVQKSIIRSRIGSKVVKTTIKMSITNCPPIL